MNGVQSVTVGGAVVGGVVVSGLLESDCPPGGSRRISRISGYLMRSSFHSIGSEKCPWTVTVSQGQRLSLSIIYVTSTSSSSSSSHSAQQSPLVYDPSSSSSFSTATCSSSVVIDDVIAARRMQLGVCVVGRRLQRHLMTSTGNTVVVHVIGDVRANGADFLLRYSGANVDLNFWFIFSLKFHFYINCELPLYETLSQNSTVQVTRDEGGEGKSPSDFYSAFIFGYILLEEL